MAVEQIQVNIVSSVDDLLGIVVGIVSDVKAGKKPSQVVSDAVPELISALGEIGDLSADVAQHAALENTVALKLSSIVNIFVP